VEKKFIGVNIRRAGDANTEGGSKKEKKASKASRPVRFARKCTKPARRERQFHRVSGRSLKRRGGGLSL